MKDPRVPGNTCWEPLFQRLQLEYRNELGTQEGYFLYTPEIMGLELDLGIIYSESREKSTTMNTAVFPELLWLAGILWLAPSVLVIPTPYHLHWAHFCWGLVTKRSQSLGLSTGARDEVAWVWISVWQFLIYTTWLLCLFVSLSPLVNILLPAFQGCCANQIN